MTHATSTNTASTIAIQSSFKANPIIPSRMATSLIAMTKATSPSTNLKNPMTHLLFRLSLLSRPSVGERACLSLTSHTRLNDYVLVRSPELDRRAVRSQGRHQAVTHPFSKLAEPDWLNLAACALC